MALSRSVSLILAEEGKKVKTQGQGSKKESVAKKGNGKVDITKKKELVHTVVYGDNLWNLAKRYFGAGNKFKLIYDANIEAIEGIRKKKGNSRHYKGYWILPGMKLVIPIEQAAPSKESNNIKEGSNKKGSKKKETGKSGNGANIADYVTEFSYTDIADGKSDSISVTLCDIKKEWLGKKRPKKGSRFNAKLRLNNYSDKAKKKIFECGSFTIDDVSFSGRPLVCNINGVNIPISNDFKTLKRTKVWQKATLKDIALSIAKTAKVSLVYDADTISIDELEQSSQEDSSFLYDLCTKYGLGMKVYKKKIVIFDFVKYEKKKAVNTINEGDMLSWSANTTIEGTYTGVKFSYTNPVKNVKGTEKSRKGNKKKEVTKLMIGKKGRLLYINNYTSGKHDAELQAKAALNVANRQMETMNITIMGGKKFVSTQCIKIKGLKGLDGKYFIDEIRHSLGSGGYVMELNLHKVQKPF